MSTSRRPRFFRDTRGAVAIEYALLAVLIALGIVASLRGTKSGVSQQLDAASYNMNQATGGTQLAVARVFAPSALTENGVRYTQVTTRYWAAGTGINNVPGACPCTQRIVRTPLDPATAPYVNAVFDIDSASNIVGVTTSFADGTQAFDKRTPLYGGVTIVAHQDVSGSFTYREAQTTANGIITGTRTVLEQSGSTPWKTYQYVVDQSTPGVSVEIGSIQTNNDGSVIRTGQDIGPYF